MWKIVFSLLSVQGEKIRPDIATVQKSFLAKNKTKIYLFEVFRKMCEF
jgi:hypothetical protein